MDRHEKMMQAVHTATNFEKTMSAALITPEYINTIQKATQAIQGIAQNEATLQVAKTISQLDKFIRVTIQTPEFINTMQSFHKAVQGIARSDAVLQAAGALSNFDKSMRAVLVTPEFINTIQTIHKNVAALHASTAISQHLNSINSILSNVNFSGVEIRDEAGSLIIDNEVIGENDVNDLSNTLMEYCKTGKEYLITGLKKSLQYIVKKYVDWLIFGILFYGIPENSIFHHKFYSSKFFSKPTPVQKKQIKRIKFEHKKNISPKYIVNRRIMPVYRYANRKSGAVGFLCFGNQVTVVKSINKKRWLFIEWTFNGNKESGWVLGRYIEKVTLGEKK